MNHLAAVATLCSDCAETLQRRRARTHARARSLAHIQVGNYTEADVGDFSGVHASKRARLANVLTEISPFFQAPSANPTSERPDLLQVRARLPGIHSYFTSRDSRGLAHLPSAPLQRSVACFL